MESYRCIVYDKNNKRRVINLNLECEKDVMTYMKNNNLKLSSLKTKKNISCLSQKLKDKELKILCNQLAILFESGCEITDSLDIIKNQSSKRITIVLDKILHKLKSGNNMTDAFKSTNAFSNFFISMLQAGEISSNLDNIMYRLHEYYDKEAKLKSKIIGISIYPIILAIVTFTMVVIVLVFIMPQYESIYINNNIQIPATTKILINLSHFTINNYPIIIIGSFIFIITLIYLFNNNENIRTNLYKISIKLPVIGDYRRIKLTNRFSKSFYILMKSGVQVVEAIDISAKVIDKDYIYDSLCEANDYIKRGNSIGKSLEKINLFPKLFITMITIGEVTGRLDNLLESINKFYENELDEKIELGTKYFEVGIILVMGISVGMIVISMVVPMFSAISSF